MAVAGSERLVRSLMRLRESASTARTLNLHAVWERHAENTPDYTLRPLFQHLLLNRSIILKHRLRLHEYEFFETDRSVATKVIIPIDLEDLRAGARVFFVGQVGYEDALRELFGADVGGAPNWADVAMLELLDSLPSFDPFLMRERLKKSGHNPARCYFDISDADAARMFNFLKQELTPLIGASFGELEVQLNERTSKLASKILENAADAELDPLRQGMGMDRAAFEEGVFCWKGFIYYKWVLSALLPQMKPVAAEIATVRALGRPTDDEFAFITGARQRLHRLLGVTWLTVKETLGFYEKAYLELTKNGQPTAFRDFLMKAPAMFYEVGERLGALQHIISFWRYRFPPGARMALEADELIDILSDFENSLSHDPLKEAGI